MAPITPNPLAFIRISRHLIPAHALLPNTSIQKKPLIIYHAAFPSSATASGVEAHLTSVGAVVPQWRYSMYNTTHFHSTTHELLTIVSGRAELCFGGEQNQQNLVYTATKGDVILVPAGVGHRLMKDLDGGFEMVGSYPPGCSWDMCYGRPGEEEKVKNISNLEWFSSDPLYGARGPATDEEEKE